MYSLIGQSEFETLRKERLGALELDHYRRTLLLQEATRPHEQAAIREELAELERRMAVHQPPEDDARTEDAEPECREG